MDFADKSWLILRMNRIKKHPTHQDIEAFLEKVAVIMFNENIDEGMARLQAFDVLFCARQ